MLSRPACQFRLLPRYFAESSSWCIPALRWRECTKWILGGTESCQSKLLFRRLCPYPLPSEVPVGLSGCPNLGNQFCQEVDTETACEHKQTLCTNAKHVKAPCLSQRQFSLLTALHYHPAGSKRVLPANIELCLCFCKCEFKLWVGFSFRLNLPLRWQRRKPAVSGFA